MALSTRHTLLLVWIMAILAAGAFAIRDDVTPATAEDIAALASLASTSEAARQELADALRATPAPTRHELAVMKEDINRTLVRELSGKLTASASAARNP